MIETHTDWTEVWKRKNGFTQYNIFRSAKLRRPRTLRERSSRQWQGHFFRLVRKWKKVREKEVSSSSSYDADEKLIHLQRRKIEINECKLCVMAAKKMIIWKRRRRRCPMNEDDRSAWEQAFWAIESEKNGVATITTPTQTRLLLLLLLLCIGSICCC